MQHSQSNFSFVMTRTPAHDDSDGLRRQACPPAARRAAGQCLSVGRRPKVYRLSVLPTQSSHGNRDRHDSTCSFKPDELVVSTCPTRRGRAGSYNPLATPQERGRWYHLFFQTVTKRDNVDISYFAMTCASNAHPTHRL